MILNFGDYVKTDKSDFALDRYYVAYEIMETVEGNNTVVRYVNCYGMEKELVIPGRSNLNSHDKIGYDYAIDNRFNTGMNDDTYKCTPEATDIIKNVVSMLYNRIDFSKTFVFAMLDEESDGIKGVSLYCNGLVVASSNIAGDEGYCMWSENKEGILKELCTLIPSLTMRGAKVVIFPCIAGSVLVDRPLFSRYSGVDIELIQTVLSHMISVSVYVSDFDDDNNNFMYRIGDAGKRANISMLMGTESSVIKRVKAALLGSDATLPSKWYVKDSYSMPMYGYSSFTYNGSYLFEGSNDDSRARVIIDYGIGEYTQIYR